jgi:hypothetical protein
MHWRIGFRYRLISAGWSQAKSSHPVSSHALQSLVQAILLKLSHTQLVKVTVIQMLQIHGQASTQLHEGRVIPASTRTTKHACNSMRRKHEQPWTQPPLLSALHSHASEPGGYPAHSAVDKAVETAVPVEFAIIQRTVPIGSFVASCRARPQRGRGQVRGIRPTGRRQPPLSPFRQPLQEYWMPLLQQA